MTESESNPMTPDRDEELERLKSENEGLRLSLDRRRRWRSVLALLLVVLSSLGVVTASIAVWVHQVVFDTDRFMATVDPVLDDPGFYLLIGDRASASVLEALAVEERLTTALENLDDYLSDALVDALELTPEAQGLLRRFDRPSLASLAPPIAAALEERIDRRIHAFFSSDQFRTRIPELVRRVHEAAVALARDQLADLPNVYVAEGEVRLNLIPFIAEALRQIGDEIRAVLPDFDLPDVIEDGVAAARQQLGDAIEARLPEDFGQVTVMSESALSGVQDVAARLDRYVWAAVLASLLLLVLAVAVSPNRRKTALHVGIGVFVAVVVASVLVRRLQSAIVEEITDPEGSELVRNIVGDTLSGLRSLELLLAVAAILVAIVAYLAGRPAWVTRMTDALRDWTDSQDGASRLDKTVARHSGAFQIGGALVAGVALFLTGLDLLSIVVIALLLGSYLWWISASARRVENVVAPPPAAEGHVDSGDRVTTEGPTDSTDSSAPGI